MPEAEPRKLASSPSGLRLLMAYCPECSRTKNILVVMHRPRPEAGTRCGNCGWQWEPMASVDEAK